MTCVFGFSEEKILENSPRHLSSLICRWLHPLPHVFNDFGMPTICLHSKSHFLFSQNGVRLTVIRIYRCEQSPMLPGPQGTCVPSAEWEEALYFLSTPTLPIFPYPMFSSRSLPLPCSRPEGWSVDILGRVGLQYRLTSLKNLNSVHGIDSYKPQYDADPWVLFNFRPLKPSTHTTELRSSCLLLPLGIDTWKCGACLP